MTGFRKNYQSGFSTLEMLIAFAILITAISSVIIVTFGNQSTTVDAQTNHEALYKAQELLENAKANAIKDFNLVNPTSTSEAVGGITYQKNLQVSPLPDLYTKQITANISWPGEGGKTISVNLSSLISNPQAVSGGDTCGSVLLGDWTNPQKTEYEFGADILEDTSSGFPITSIQAHNHKLYVTVNNNNGNNPGTFFVLNISDPSEKPLVTEEFDNNPAVGEGYNAVAVDGSHYAYLANAHGSDFATCVQNASCSQLQVVDTSVSPLVLVKSYKIPGVTGSGGQGIGTSIFYQDGIIYLGLAKATGPEFNIIDVGGAGAGGSPTNPLLVGSYEINAAVNSIHVRGTYAYIASPDNQELKILDVGNPSNPTLVGGFDAPGGGANNGNGKSIYLVGDTLYFGRTLLNGNELYILNNLDPETNLPIFGSMNVTNDGNNTSINGILVRDYLGFLITNEEFQIWRIDNPANITQYASPLTLPPGTGGGLQGTATDCEGNHIFVGSQSSNDKGYISVITGQ